jgi:DNA-binding transcriptional MerR regulator
MFSIGDFARLGNVSVRTLRYYEQLGLLMPAAVDPETGYRSYSAYQLSRLHRIVALKDLGLSLQELAPMLDDLSAEELRGMLVFKRAELQDRLAEDQARLARVELRLRHIEGEHRMPTDVVVKTMPALRVAVIRCDQPGLDFNSVRPAVTDAVLELPQRLRAGGVQLHGPLFLFYDQQADGTVIPHVAIDVGEQPLPEDDLISDTRLPETDVVSTVVHGAISHDVIGPIYGQLARWAEDHGYRAQGPGRDVIIGGSDAGADGPVIELQLPVSKTSS